MCSDQLTAFALLSSSDMDSHLTPRPLERCRLTSRSSARSLMALTLVGHVETLQGPKLRWDLAYHPRILSGGRKGKVLQRENVS